MQQVVPDEGLQMLGMELVIISSLVFAFVGFLSNKLLI